MAGWRPWRRQTADAAPAPTIGRLITSPAAGGDPADGARLDSSPAAYVGRTVPASPSTHIVFDDLHLPKIEAPPGPAAASITGTPVVTLTDAQMDAIAERVADRLASGLLGAQLRESIRRVVSDVSERLVREEIARVRAEAERD